MKKFFGLVLMFVLIAGYASAIEYFPPPQDGEGIIGGRAGQAWQKVITDNLQIGDDDTTVYEIDSSGKLERAGGATPQRSITWSPRDLQVSPVEAFFKMVGGVPLLHFDGGNNGISPVAVTLRGLPDLDTAGTTVLKALLSTDDSGQGPGIDYGVYRQISGEEIAGSEYASHDPVLMPLKWTSAGYGIASPVEVTLSLTTLEEAALADPTVTATLRFWKDYATTSTQALQIRRITLLYKPKF